MKQCKRRESAECTTPTIACTSSVNGVRKSPSLGAGFCSVVKMLLGAPVSHIKMPGFESWLP